MGPAARRALGRAPAPGRSTSSTGRRSSARSATSPGWSRRSAPGGRGEPPATIVALSGDVHHAYLAEVAFRRGAGVRSNVYQAVCSPFRNPLDDREKRAIRAATSRPARGSRPRSRAVGRGPGPADPLAPVHEPFFDNQVATIELGGRRASLRVDKTVLGDANVARLECVLERDLA